jgi:hypothetical protein
MWMNNPKLRTYLILCTGILLVLLVLKLALPGQRRNTQLLPETGGNQTVVTIEVNPTQILELRGVIEGTPLPAKNCTYTS